MPIIYYITYTVYWKLMSFLNFPERKHKGGRPKGSGVKKDALRHPMRISDDLMAIIISERRDHERLNDTVMRMFLEKANKQRNLQKKVDALDQELQKYMIKEINK